MFCCVNRRPDGHPRGCCAAKGSEKLRDYMKARAKELGLKGMRINQALCLDRCELGPSIVIYPKVSGTAPTAPPTSTKFYRSILSRAAGSNGC